MVNSFSVYEDTEDRQEEFKFLSSWQTYDDFIIMASFTPQQPSGVRYYFLPFTDEESTVRLYNAPNCTTSKWWSQNQN